MGPLMQRPTWLSLAVFAIIALCCGGAGLALAQYPPPPGYAAPPPGYAQPYPAKPPCQAVSPGPLRGAGRGAAGGAAIGAMAGDAGKGAAIGAAVGGVAGASRHATARAYGACY